MLQKILFADSVAPTRLSALRDAGHDVTVEPSLGADDLPGAIGDSTVLVVRSTRVTRSTIEAATNLDLVVRARRRVPASVKPGWCRRFPGSTGLPVRHSRQ